jgi:tetratricopeptide (TPR) repeat protein
MLLIALNLSAAGPAGADAAVLDRIQLFTQQIESGPPSQELRLRRSLAYIENNQQALALADIRVAETLGNPVAADLAHGILLYQQQDYVAARACFDRYLQGFPQNHTALEYRARLLRDSGEDRRALADYESLMTLDNSLDPGYYIAAARLMAGQPDRGVVAALALLDTHLARLGPLTPLQRYAIELEKKRGNFQGAIARMANLDEKLRATPQWQVEIAELLLLAGRPQEAIPYLSVAEEQLKSAKLPVHRGLLPIVHRLQTQAQQKAREPCGLALQPPCSQPVAAADLPPR